MTLHSTESLIESLSREAPRIAPQAAAQRLALSLSIGSALTLLAVLVILGVRHDLNPALHGMNFWMKASYTGVLGVLGIIWAAQLGRPEAPMPQWRWAVLPIAVLALIATCQFAYTAPSERTSMLLGTSWKVCAKNIILLAIPLFFAMVWVFRSFAPTHLRAAGAASGLATGALSATLYGLHCPESSMAFVLIWYSIGIVVMTLFGALSGTRLLRW